MKRTSSCRFLLLLGYVLLSIPLSSVSVFRDDRDESMERKDCMRHAGEYPVKRGQIMGRQMAIMPTPSSTIPQKSKSETRPISSVFRRPPAPWDFVTTR